MRELTPSTIAAPFAKYSHGMVVPEGFRLVFTSGQLGLSKDGITPEDAGGQAAICFANIDAVLAEAGAGRGDVVRINAFVTSRSDMAGYMAARDEWLADVAHRPASTLVIVSGFTRPEFKVEVEVIAAVRAD